MHIETINIHLHQAETSVSKAFIEALPPGSQQEAERMCSMTQKQFDHDHWLRTARKSSVRAKPYGVEDAARVCADLAAKAGWQGVEVRKVAKGKGAAC